MYPSGRTLTSTPPSRCMVRVGKASSSAALRVIQKWLSLQVSYGCVFVSFEKATKEAAKQRGEDENGKNQRERKGNKEDCRGRNARAQIAPVTREQQQYRVWNLCTTWPSTISGSAPAVVIDDITMKPVFGFSPLICFGDWLFGVKTNSADMQLTTQQHKAA